MDEQKDEVKNMNQMMLYSKCVTIRDAQLEEKKHIMAEAQEEERRMDLMMEIEAHEGAGPVRGARASATGGQEEGSGGTDEAN